MKILRFFPLAFISNIHGFAIFAPYMVAFITVAHVSRRLAPVRVK